MKGQMRGFDIGIPGLSLYFITDKDELVGTKFDTRLPRKLKKKRKKDSNDCRRIKNLHQKKVRQS